MILNRLTVSALEMNDQVKSIGRNLFLVAAWIWLFRPIFPYLQIVFTRQDFRTNQITAVFIILLILSRIPRQSLPIKSLGAPAHFRQAPLLISIISAIGFLLNERFLDVNTLSASLFGLGSYGLLGLWLDLGRWRRGFPAALLLVGALPFGHHMQTFIGYPMRIGTAVIIRNALLALGIGTVGVDTILILENGVSHIDLPCSGVQSLWTGTLFLLAATWIEERIINLRWLFTIAVFMCLLFLANLTRVAILVGVGSVMGWHLGAEMLHVPLGVLGFAVACLAALWLLRNLGKRHVLRIPYGVSEAFYATRNTQYAFAAFLFALSFFYMERPSTGLTQPVPSWQFTTEFETTPLPLKPDEYAWLTRDGAESADRFTFSYGSLSGSMILISSSTWRAHHRPERCFEVYGLSIDDSRTHLVSPSFPLRFVSLDEGAYSASYWFQSAETITDDYATRIWADVAPQRERWMLVSMIFDGDVDLESAEVTKFYEMLETAVSQTLTAD